MNNENNVEETENQEVETQETEPTQVEDKNVESHDDKFDKALEKFQKRLGKITGEKHSLEKENAELRKQLEEQNQAKSVKKLSDEDKAKKLDEEKDARIKELEKKLAINDNLSQVDQVFRESGLSVPLDVMNIIVTDNAETSYKNAQAIINFASQIAKDKRVELLKGTTPNRTGQQVKSVTKEDFQRMTYGEKVQLYHEDPETYNKLIK